MDRELELFPVQASTMAPRIDALYLFLVWLTVIITIAIAVLVIYFAVRYRRGAQVDRTQPRTSVWLEVSWLVVPLPILMGIFVWSAVDFFAVQRPPAGAMDFWVVGKQWMWKLQHPQGRREIDTLHVPIDRPVRLSMISQDVIHSFFVPAFRVKQDVLPGRYTHLWFQATRPGEYHLFCAEYCGTNHSRMIGKVIAMRPEDYQAWLAGAAADEDPLVAGMRLFEQFRCDTCHLGGGVQSRGPALEGLFGRPVTLTTGEQVIADENYLRRSILEPQAQIVAGYPPIMPSFAGQIGEEGITHLIAYIKSLGPQGGTQGLPQGGKQP